MNKQKIIFRFSFFSELLESKNVDTEDFKCFSDLIESFYKIGEQRILTTGKSVTNRFTSISFQAQRFYNTDIEIASLEWTKYWESYIDEIQLLRKKYNLRLVLVCEFITYGNLPAVIFPLDFVKFMANNDIEFSIDFYE